MGLNLRVDSVLRFEVSIFAILQIPPDFNVEVVCFVIILRVCVLVHFVDVIVSVGVIKFRNFVGFGIFVCLVHILVSVSDRTVISIANSVRMSVTIPFAVSVSSVATVKGSVSPMAVIGFVSSESSVMGFMSTISAIVRLVSTISAIMGLESTEAVIRSVCSVAVMGFKSAIASA